MSKKSSGSRNPSSASASNRSMATVSCSNEKLLMAALERGHNCLETGRLLISYREGRLEEGIKTLKDKKLRIADARDFADKAVHFEEADDADVIVFPELGVALLGGDALEQQGINLYDEVTADSPIQIIEPEYFAFSENSEYLRGFLSAARTIAKDLGVDIGEQDNNSCETKVPDATWGLAACNVLQSRWSGHGIKVAILDTGMDLGHPDFENRGFETQSFVGEPVHDINGHGTHCVGTACGPRSPAVGVPRYGVAYGAQILVGKVLANSGSSTGASVLAGMNWAIANHCEIISMSLGSQSPVQEAYTHAGAAALRKGLLIIAAAGNSSASTGAPANSPTIMSIASLDANFEPSSFSNFGKVELAAPGRDIFSAWPRPHEYRSISGTSMATPHVAGIAALWAESDASLRGEALWQKLIASVKGLPHDDSRVGAGLVQAP